MQQIIKKLSLVPSKRRLGASFVNGIPVYQYADFIFCAQCDHQGYPVRNDLFLFFSPQTGKHVHLTSELILTEPYEIVHSVIEKATLPTSSGQWVIGNDGSLKTK